MQDRFEELSSQVIRELTEVFSRMDDTNVRELLEEIKKAPRIFLLAAGREGLATKAFAMRLMHLGKDAFGFGMIPLLLLAGRFNDLRLRLCKCRT